VLYKNILIIALPRSGGTAVMKDLAEENNLTSRFEPELQSDIVEPKNDVTKVIVDRFKLSDLYDLALKYEKVILHSRRDSIACSESLAYMHWFQGKDGLALSPWSDGLLNTIPRWYIEQTRHRIDHSNNLLLLISRKLNIEVQYYEDVFDMSSSSRLRNYTKASLV
jgi:hypothetical protein